MAEEIIREMKNVWELYQVFEQIYPSSDGPRHQHLPGHETFLVQEGDELETRQYRIVDADGNALKWPLKLVSDTRIVI